MARSWMMGMGMLLSNTLHANTDVVLAMSGGPAWYYAGQTQTLTLQPEFQNAYIAKRSQHVVASGGWFAGIERPLVSNVSGQWGLAVATTSHTQLNGTIWETADPLLNNFTYQYNEQHTHVALKSKWLWEGWHHTCQPYISGSVGVGWNRAQQFSMKSMLFEARAPAPFTDYTQTTFTYTWGAGVQKALSNVWFLGVGYERADWGKSRLGPAFGQTIGTGLVLNHLYTNALQVSISYLVQG